MKAIIPQSINDVTLQTSNVAENDFAAFNIATTYAINTTLIYVTTNIHWVIRSKVAGNVGNIPTGLSSDVNWLKVSETNRWKMFDLKTTSQTFNTDSIDVTLIATIQVDALAILNFSATGLTVIGNDQYGAIIYSYSANLISQEGIDSPYAYFFNPLVYTTDLVLQDLPPYALSSYQIILTSAGETVKVGTCLIGAKQEIGESRYGMQIGLTDYSIKKADEFGDFMITERAYSKTLSVSNYVLNTRIAAQINIFNRYRATPLVWLGADDFSSSFVYGFYKDYQVIVDYLQYSFVNLEIEGLS